MAVGWNPGPAVSKVRRRMEGTESLISSGIREPGGRLQKRNLLASLNLLEYSESSDSDSGFIQKGQRGPVTEQKSRKNGISHCHRGAIRGNLS